MAKKKMTQFESWFKAQFGSLPRTEEEMSPLYRRLAYARAEVQALEAAFREEASITNQWNAALKSREAGKSGYRF
jgi:hypothetical protein